MEKEEGIQARASGKNLKPPRVEGRGNWTEREEGRGDCRPSLFPHLSPRECLLLNDPLHTLTYPVEATKRLKEKTEQTLLRARIHRENVEGLRVSESEMSVEVRGGEIKKGQRGEKDKADARGWPHSSSHSTNTCN